MTCAGPAMKELIVLQGGEGMLRKNDQTAWAVLWREDSTKAMETPMRQGNVS